MKIQGISGAKSKLGFKKHTVPNIVTKTTKSAKDLFVRGAVFVTAVSMVLSTFAPTAVVFADHDPFQEELQTKVKICHSGNGKNFVSNEPSISGTGANPSFAGHENHASDVIPPFHYIGGEYAGKNWTAANEILWNNGNCDGISDDETGNIKIVKTSIGGDGTFDFVTTGTGFSLEPLETVNGTASVMVTGLADKGIFSISESAEAGWTQTSATCDGGNNTISNITVKKDKTVTCTFVNTKDVVVDRCDDLQTPEVVEPCPPVERDVVVTKSWQGFGQGQGPTNKTDITIEVTGNDDAEKCTYKDDVFDCETTFIQGNTIDINESGVPAGWEVDPTTVGDVTPNCPQDEQADCTVEVKNVRKTAEPCSTELMVNGGFELPEVTNGAKWDVFPSGSAGLGWSVEWVRTDGDQPDIANMELHEGVLGNAFEGNQYTELDSDWGGPESGQSGEDASVKIYQDISTKVGSTYTLKFATSPRPNNQPAAQNEIRLDIDGNLVDVYNNTSAGAITWTENEVEFEAASTITRIEFTDIGPGNSFGGFLDDVSVVEDCTTDVEICKLDNNRNYLPGWEVYLKGDKVEKVTVPATDTDGVTSVANLESGTDYIFVASGTANAGDGIEFDADYSFRTPTSSTWTDSVSTYEGLGDTLLDLMVNGGFVNWDNDSVYNPDHVYTYEFTGTGASVSFQVSDTFPSNNSGSISVDIFPIYKGTTEKDGCVTIENVPNGNYILDEIMQDGWEYVSGDQGEVKVGGEDNSFVLVNECTGDNCVIPCVDGPNWAKKVESFNQGKRKDGSNVLPERSDPSKALGTAQDNDTENFVSLGFGGEIVLSFGGTFYNVAGPDIELVETSYGAPTDLNYPEKIKVSVSTDGVSWTEIGDFTQDEEIDMDGFASSANFVKLTDVSDKTSSKFNNATDGFDVDGVMVYQVNCVPPPEPCTAEPTDVSLISDTSTDTAGWTNVNPTADPLNSVAYNDSSFGAASIANTVIPPLVDPANYAPFTGSGAVWVSTTEAHPGQGGGEGNPNEDQWRLFSKSFSVPAGVDVSEGTLSFTADNAVSVYLNGVLLDDTSENLGTFNVPHPQGPYQVFSQVYSVNFTPVAGQVNTLEFVVRNSGGQYGENPTALLYKADFSYNCDDETEGGYNISGKVYNDKDNNNDFNGADSGLADWIVNLFKLEPYEGEGGGEGYVPSDTTASDANGDYSFNNVEPGCYLVDEVEQAEWNQTEPTTEGHQYYVAIGGVDCDFPYEDYASSGDGVLDKVASLFIKEAVACVPATDNDHDGVVISNCDAVSLDFGNYKASTGSGGQGFSTSSSGSSTPDVNGRVLGDSIGLPYQNPRVLGAATTLPRTGAPISLILIVFAALAITLVPIRASLKKN